jgi:membrane protease YdiL (CAAX protease family)
MRGKLPTPLSAFALFLITGFLNLVVGMILVTFSTDLGLVLVVPLAVLLPTLLFTWFLKLDLRRTLLLRLPSLTDILLALPLAFALAVINDQLTNLVNLFFPLDEEFQRRMVELLRTTGSVDWAVKILGIGIGAAVSEELLFRGFILRGFEQRLRRSTAIILAALLFAAMHMIPQGIPSYFLAGVVLGIVAIATRSILVPMVVHLIFNMSALALLNLAGIETLGRPLWIPAGILVPALLIFGLILGYFVRKMPAPAPRELPLTPQAPSPFPESEPLPDSLATISPERRRLGWLAVGCAVVLGTAVILGLFSYFIYQGGSRQNHAVLIEDMKQNVLKSLPPTASQRRRVEQRFEALAAVNEAGRLGLLDMGRVYGIYLQSNSDGSITLDEIEVLLEEIDSIVEANPPTRRL